MMLAFCIWAEEEATEGGGAASAAADQWFSCWPFESPTSSVILRKAFFPPPPHGPSGRRGRRSRPIIAARAPAIDHTTSSFPVSHECCPFFSSHECSGPQSPSTYHWSTSSHEQSYFSVLCPSRLQAMTHHTPALPHHPPHPPWRPLRRRRHPMLPQTLPCCWAVVASHLLVPRMQALLGSV